jgi:hypothetical protein
LSKEFMNQPPSYRDGKKYFLKSRLEEGPKPFAVVPLEILTPNGRKLVEDFQGSAGLFLGGGVFKSSSLEMMAKSDPQAAQIHQMMRKYVSSLPAREVVRRSPEFTNEWIALEYALLLSLTMYGWIRPIPWDSIASITVRKKGFITSDFVANIAYVTPNGLDAEAEIQANKHGIESLYLIAEACGVLTERV